jgi:spermidine synthase
MARAETADPGARLAPLLLLFFLSGASALVYQVLWMRLLALVFGVTVHAASTVLAAFMAGLALGSVAAGRLADRVRRPLVVFAAAEALIAVAALATTSALGGVEAVYIWLHSFLGDVPVVLGIVRLALSFAVLVVPATLMGATLPLVVKSTLGRGRILGRQVSLLYATNTAGAIAGALVAGIWMVPQLGIWWAFRLGALTNLIVAAGALALARLSTTDSFAVPSQSETDRTTTGAEGETARGFSPVVDPAVRRLVMLTFAVSGFASFALEIIWFRMLVVLLRPTTYAFTVMLATVLAGIAAGSWLSSAFTRKPRANALTALAILELLLAVTALESMFMIGRVAAVSAWANPLFTGGRLDYLGPLAVTSMVAIFPAAVLMGMAFPIGIAIWAADVGHAQAGERIGTIYAINVAGAVAGSLLTGFLLLPAIGSRPSLVLISALVLTTGMLLLARLRRSPGGLAIGAIASIAFVFIAWRTPDPVMRLLHSRYPGELPVWRQEDGHATVTILRRDSRFAPQPVRRLYINGMHQASDEPGMVAYHRIIGTLPLALHPDPRTALVIGVGGGATAGAVSAFGDHVAVDVVELSPAVVGAARQFQDINQNLLQRPNVHLRVDDGRNYMLLTSERYDVVTADVILPVHAGAGNLYSREYYQLMRHVLRNRGVALQWIGSQTVTEYKMIMRTFLAVFPHTTLWQGGTLMIGATRPLVLEEEAFLRKQAEPANRQALDAMGLTSFEALLARYTAGPAELKAFVGEGPLLTDDRPLTEYFLAMPRTDATIDLSQLHGDVRRHVVRMSASASPSDN